MFNSLNSHYFLLLNFHYFHFAQFFFFFCFTVPPSYDSPTDPCTTKPCDHYCTTNVSSGVAVCQCRQGFLLAGDGLSCQDINECAKDNSGCYHRCHNTEGHFYCSCKYGYQLEMDGFNCTYQPLLPPKQQSNPLPPHYYPMLPPPSYYSWAPRYYWSSRYYWYRPRMMSRSHNGYFDQSLYRSTRRPPSYGPSTTHHHHH